jgi:flagellar biosynthesis component FlhA
MKKTTLFFASAALLLVTACNQATEGKESGAEENVEQATEASEEVAEESKQEDNHFGQMLAVEGAKTIDEFATMMEGKDSLRVKIRAVATDVCQKKGCWMKVETADGSLMRIKFKDYGFFVPKDITGKHIVFEGLAFRDTVSVEDLRHYAEDGGQTEEEIAAITEPEINTSFIADGVVIMD